MFNPLVRPMHLAHDEYPKSPQLKYGHQGLEVVGITVNDKPELSDSVVHKRNIPFPQIYKSAPMSTYGVTAIPETILFAPDGTILARGLRGEEIEKKLAEFFRK